MNDSHKIFCGECSQYFFSLFFLHIKSVYLRVAIFEFLINRCKLFASMSGLISFSVWIKSALIKSFDLSSFLDQRLVVIVSRLDVVGSSPFTLPFL